MTVEHGTNAHLAKVHLSFKPGSTKKLIRSKKIVSQFRRDLTQNLSRETIEGYPIPGALHPGAALLTEQVKSSIL